MTYTIDHLTSLIGARRWGTRPCRIAFLLTDSRSLRFPEETLFFALRTTRNDGHQYIAELYERGVRNFVVDHLPEQVEDKYSEANFLCVDHVLGALQQIARNHRQCFQVPVVGVTGSNGKTIVKEWIYQILSDEKVITRSPRSYNSQIGVPLSVWNLDEQTQLGVFEAGVSQPGEMEALQQIIQPTIAVLTSLGTAHQENFSSFREKCMEKLRLFQGAGTMVYCQDDSLIAQCIKSSCLTAVPLTWSLTDKGAAMYIENVEKKGFSTHVDYVFKGEKASYRLPFIDEASVHNSIICAIIALYLGLSTEKLAAAMQHLERIGMRLEVKEGRNGCTLINDSYNSDVNSLDIALDFMNRRPDHQARSRTLILSDIEQTGRCPEELYQEVSKLAAERSIRTFIGIGTTIAAQQQHIQIPVKHFFDTTEQLLRSGLLGRLRNEVVLIKGARRFGFEKITETLAQQVHETTLEVNLNAVVENLNHYRNHLKPGTKITCMIKADGYGTGAVEIAKTLQEHRVDYLAVAVADEGMTLRRNGITSNIIIMNPEINALKLLFDYNLEPEVYNFRILNALIAEAGRHGITGLPVHIKLDTGMHRLGFHPVNDMQQLVNCLKHQKAIIPKSVFSHFAGADADEFDSFSASQFELFDKASQELQAAFSHKILRHICNSAAIEHFPQYHLDMCRLGLGLYGINPRTNQLMHNVATLKTTILQIRDVEANQTVGYSRRETLQNDARIAAIPIGYADGLNRRLGNRRCHCLVNGQPASYVGNICMDVALIDVTGIVCQEGDTVEIFGDQLPVTVLSDQLETIPYEVLTGISNRVKRVYFQD